MIEVKNLQKKYGELEVLKNINTTISKGDVISYHRSKWRRKKYIFTLHQSLRTS